MSELSAVERLIDEAIQTRELQNEEQERIKAEQLREIEKSHDRMIAHLIKLLGIDVWGLLGSSSELTYSDWFSMVFAIDGPALEMIPFTITVSRQGDSFFVDVKSRLGGRSVVSSASSFGNLLLQFREEYPNWKARQDEEAEIEAENAKRKALMAEYRAALEEWRTEWKKIQTENFRRVQEAQAAIPPYEVYDLEYAVLAADYEEGDQIIERYHAPVLDPRPAGEHWGVIEKGKIVLTKFFYPISINKEGVEIQPGKHNPPFSGDLFAVHKIQGFEIEYIGIDIEGYLPDLLPDPDMPKPPEGLDQDDINNLLYSLNL